MAIQNSFNNTLKGNVAIAFGGDATGDIYYRNSGGSLTRLGVGANGQFLTLASGLPAWATLNTSPTGNAGGDLTGTYPNPTIAANAVSFAKIQNIADQTILGNNSGVTGNITALAPAAIRTILGLGTAALLNVGTAANNIVQLDAGAKIPANLVPNVNLTSFYGVVANQAARLALTTTQVQPNDSVKQADNGITYILTATDPSVDVNWVSVGDTSIDASDIVSGVLATARLGSSVANSTTVLFGDQTYKALYYIPLAGNSVTGTTVAMAANNAYRLNNAALVTATLPTVAAIDTIIQIVGIGAGGWRMAQNAGQQVHFGSLDTTSGNSGQLNSTHYRDCVTLQCVVANTEWQVISAIGNIDVI